MPDIVTTCYQPLLPTLPLSLSSYNKFLANGTFYVFFGDYLSCVRINIYVHTHRMYKKISQYTNSIQTELAFGLASRLEAEEAPVAAFRSAGETRFGD